MHEIPRRPSPRHTVASRVCLTLIVLLTALCIALPLFAGPSGIDVLIPAVARDSDSAGVSTPTPLTLSNPGVTAATVTVTLHRRDVSQEALEIATVNLAAGETRRFGDVLRDLFDTEGAGVLRVAADANVTLRSGDSVPASAAIATGQTARVHPAAAGAVSPGSLSVVETSGRGVFVRLTVRDADDNELGSLESPVRAHEEKAWRVADVLPGTGLEPGTRVEATVLAGPGRVVVFARQGSVPRAPEQTTAARGEAR